MQPHGDGGNWLAPQWLVDFVAGGVSGCVAKTATAPFERVKLLVQTQDANPQVSLQRIACHPMLSRAIKSHPRRGLVVTVLSLAVLQIMRGEVKRYKGTIETLRRVRQEQGVN